MRQPGFSTIEHSISRWWQRRTRFLIRYAMDSSFRPWMSLALDLHSVLTAERNINNNTYNVRLAGKYYQLPASYHTPIFNLQGQTIWNVIEGDFGLRGVNRFVSTTEVEGVFAKAQIDIIQCFIEHISLMVALIEK